MKTIVLITMNSEKWIKKVLKRIKQEGEFNLIIIDNMSTDNTVPMIVGEVGFGFIKEEQYKFFINTKVKTREECVDMINKLTDKNYLLIDDNMNKMKLRKRLKDVTN